MKHLTQSIQERLKNVARTGNKSFQLILTRYLQERLLYRLSQSPFNVNFCLKGGALLYAWERETSRPTLDIDLLAIEIQRDLDRLAAVFKSLCSIGYPEDGVFFDPATVQASEIMGTGVNSGVRIKIQCSLGQIRQILTVDIGFGDSVTPSPVQLIYPVILDMHAPALIAYSPETVIAEKLEAMIDLAEANSRMKDFYDVFHLLIRQRYDSGILREAIAQTFRNRGTPLNPDHSIFQSAFAEDPMRIQMWDRFLARTQLDVQLPFQHVMRTLTSILSPLLRAEAP